MIHDMVFSRVQWPPTYRPGGEFGVIAEGAAGEVAGGFGPYGEHMGKEDVKTKAPQKCAAHFVPAMEACKCCGREYLKRRSWQRTCSRECQLILLAADKVVKAIRAGCADGLRDVIEELTGLRP